MPKTLGMSNHGACVLSAFSTALSSKRRCLVKLLSLKPLGQEERPRLFAICFALMPQP